MNNDDGDDPTREAYKAGWDACQKRLAETAGQDWDQEAFLKWERKAEKNNKFVPSWAVAKEQHERTAAGYEAKIAELKQRLSYQIDQSLMHESQWVKALKEKHAFKKERDEALAKLAQVVHQWQEAAIAWGKERDALKEKNKLLEDCYHATFQREVELKEKCARYEKAIENLSHAISACNVLNWKLGETEPYLLEAAREMVALAKD